MSLDRPILIIETGRPVPQLRRHGSFAHWIRHAARLPRNRAVACNVEAGDALPDSVEGFAGAIISGSPAMVTQRLDWSETTAQWLRDAAEAGLPLFGVCYGHQLLAHAFGGSVGDNPQGREIGTVDVHCEAVAADDRLFRGLLSPFRAQVSHLQTVTSPPTEATVLATSSLDDCQAFRLGDRVWGVQFHPEFSSTITAGYVRARADRIREEGHDPAAILADIGAAPLARQVLRRFVRFADTMRQD
ncbi:MAG: glutamine amidotransferase [Lysobacteraceae bacterium]